MKLTTIEKPVKESKDFVKLVEEGNYFKEMDNAIENSPTATMVVLQFKKYCVLPDLKPEYVDLWNKIVDEKIRYGMFTLWTKYDIDLEVNSVYFRLSKNYRAKKKDDVGNVSQFLNVNTNKIFPAFNSDKKVVKSQIEKAGDFRKFSGQIFQYNTTSRDYEVTPLFSVLKYMKIEDDTPDHINSSADNALFGNNIFLMKKGADSSNDTDENGEKTITNTDRVVGALRQAKSVKNSGTNHVLEVVADNDVDLTKSFVKVEIGNDVDVDKFNAVDEKASKKICIAGYNFPSILANPSEGLFGNSGDALDTAINYWKTTCEYEAEKIEEVFLKIGIELQNKKEEIVEPEADRTDEQKALMAFSGTVPNILELQKSVQSGATTLDSGKAMLMLLYGFKEEEATAIIGTPKEITPAPPTNETI
jgi:hypothetical protein